jgi:geranylgeranyl diphosphate synthase type II
MTDKTQRMTSTTTNVADFLDAKAQRCQSAMQDHLDALRDLPPALREAMAYSLFAGGKRLRPALAMGAAEIIGNDDASALPAACAIEMIHTYSLIHDDLPCMDDDDLRRGKPTAHKKFGEAIAVLAGDALLTLAFDIAASTDRSDVVRLIAQASGAGGMAGGQVLDILSEGKQVSLLELQRIHAAKTGALISASVCAGAMLANADADQLAAMKAYGEHLGLAFQIADDILDVVGDEAAIGKPVGSDEALNKSTYPGLVGLDQARVLARKAADAAVDALAPFGESANTFRALAAYVVDRNS